MPKRTFSPALFDTAQDISLGVPYDLVWEWGTGDQSPERAKALLSNKTAQGTTVVSDSSGLTKLTAEKGIIEILALIDIPKRLIYSYGTAIGGVGIGVWAADNTQMWYPPSVAPAHIASMLLELQKVLVKESVIKIGFGMHTGSFYEIGGGLAGPEAELIEEIAENVSAGGEILVTESTSKLLGRGSTFVFEEKENAPDHVGRVLRLARGPESQVSLGTITDRYPIPYSIDFHTDLVEYGRDFARDHEQLLETKYTQEKVVLLVERTRDDSPSTEEQLLSDLALSVVVAGTGRKLMSETIQEIKIAGALAIYVADDAQELFRFAKNLSIALAREGISLRMGMTQGSVLIFDLPRGSRDIAGAPVNVASKMAQDEGSFGSLYVASNVTRLIPEEQGAAISFGVSGTTIDAVRFRLETM